MKTALTNLLHRNPGRRPFAALLWALVCVAGADTCLAAKNSPPAAQNLSVVAAANLSTPIVLLGSDPNGDPLTFSIVSPPTQGTLSGTAPNLIYTPRSDFLGPDSFTYRVSDGKATSNPATVSIVVKVGLSINSISVIEGNSGTTAATFTVTLTANPGLLGLNFKYRTIDDTAIGSGLPIVTGADYLKANQTVLTAALLTPVTVSVLGDAQIEPDETFFVELFEPSDNAIILNGTGRCTIVNDDRVIQPPTAVDLSIVAAANRSTSIVLQGSDPQGVPLTFSLVSSPLHGFLSGTAPNLIYTTTGDFVGLDGFAYVVSNGQATSQPATVSINVKNGLEIDDISITEGTSGTTTAIFTVTLTARPDPMGVTFSYRTMDGTAVGSDLPITPDADYVAASQTVLATTRKNFITVQVLGDTRFEPDETFFVELFNPSDNAVILNGIGRCTILNDDPVIPAPTALSFAVVAVANRSTPIVLAGTDPQGLPLTFSIVSGPQHGTLSGLAPNLIHTPVQDFTGPDSFTYVASNGQVTSNPATVSIAVKHGLSINNISVTEGNSGTKAATFTVTMTAPGTEFDVVSVRFQTADGTAQAGLDYGATSGTISFAPGVLSQFITINLIGDTLVEFNETFLVELINDQQTLPPSPTLNAVIVNGTGRCTILDDDTSRTQIGTAALAPEDSIVQVGEPVNLSLTWTHPVGWRQLDSVDLLIVDDQGAILDTRWHEAENSFSFFNPAADRFVRTAAAGSPARFETSGVALYLQECTGGGPPGQTATIDFSLSFKPEAAGRTFSVEAFATDDAGNQQGFESVGTIAVLPR